MLAFNLIMDWLFRQIPCMLPAVFLALMTCACGAPRVIYHPDPNTCVVKDSASGHPECLPLPGFFCVDPPDESAADNGVGRNATFIAQAPSLFPSKESLGAMQPICPPNSTRLMQEFEWKDAKKGAKAIGHTVGRVLTICETILDHMSRQPDHILAGWNDIQPETLEAVFTKCTSELDTLPAIPEYDDPWLAGAASQGFREGYGDGVDEVYYRLLAMELAIAAVEVAVTGGLDLVEVAVTRGIRLSLNAVRRMPIFIPGAVGGVGVYIRGMPKAAMKAVAKGSSRRLGNNLEAHGIHRLSGEFAHHIVAHNDPRAAKSLEILESFDIKVDNWVNGVYLPGYKTSPNPRGKIVHGNVHTNAYYEAVYNTLQDAKSQAEVIQSLRLLAFKLEHGVMP